MRSYQKFVWSILLGTIANITAINAAFAIELTQTTTIASSNSSYDGQDLIVNATTLTINGSHQFNSVQLINGAVLTHSLSPDTKLEITSKTFFVDASSRIDLTGKGHLPTAAVTGASGGSYGGLGGIYEDSGTTNPVFGNPALPTDFGIGGIGSAGKTHGGGSIKLITDELTLDGLIVANGQDFNTFFSSQGGGSGGSIFLDVGELSGAGSIDASGGSGFTFYGGGGGGGGRIAVYYDSATFNFRNIINLGGVCKPLFGEHGQNGSIYLEKTIAENKAPVANAGLSLAVQEQSEVILNGSATDADGTIASYHWSQLSGPAVSLVNSNTTAASFTAPVVLSDASPTVLQFRLTVVDDQGASASADTSIGVLALNAIPVAHAGADFSVNEASVVNLTGNGDDSDGHITGYQWTQTSGNAVTINNSNTASASFIAPSTKQIERLGFKLTVTDNESGIHSDNVFITVNPVNTLPTAMVVSPTPVAENTFTRLDGSGSNDTDGSISRYSWTQIAGPAIALFNANSATPSFSTPSVYQDTTLSFRLDVLDDEAGVASAITHLTVFDVNTDDDSDGMLDTWEMLFFNTLTHDGATDTDGDGATDLQEFEFGTNPTTEQQPAQPEIVSPDAIEVTALFPELSLINPNQHSGFPVSYEFEVYSDATMSQLIASASGNRLNWTVNTELTDNTRYYWRARAIGATLFSDWVNSSFFINTANDAPGAFNISYPQDGVWVASFTPTLSVTNSTDIDEDALSYRFEVYANAVLIAASEELLAGRNGTTSWTVDVPLLENSLYHWRVIVTDEHGLSTTSSEPMIFINTVNDAPETPTPASPLDGSEITSLYTDLIVNNSNDPEGEAVYYLFELDTVNTFDGTNRQDSDAISETPLNTAWSVDRLRDNTWYYWRTKASDGLAESLWSNGQFFVNQFNDAPGIPKALNPGDHGWTGSLQPTLEVYPATDIDGDALSYEFAIYQATNAGIEPELVSTGISSNTFWQPESALPESGNYYWHARAIDEHGLAGSWGELVTFFADDDGINDTPVIQLKNIKQEHDANDETSQVEIKWTDYDPDSNARISLYYDTDQYGEDGVLIVQGISEDPDSDYDSFKWDISQVQAGVYFIYAMIDDGNTTSVNYSNNAVIVGDGGGLPYLAFKTTENENQGKRNQRALIQWRDLDSDSNAVIELYYDSDSTGFDGSLIATGIEEDADGNADHFLWDTSTLAEGAYYIYAIVSDQTNSYQVYSDKAVTIKHGEDKH